MISILELKHKLVSQGLALVISKDEELFVEEDRGVKPIIKHYDLGNLAKASLCDKVIGKAGAMFMVAGGVKAAHGVVISQPALDVLEEAGVKVSYDRIVPNIINRNGDGLCPMESAVLDEDDLEVAMAKIRAKVEELSSL